eukprot:TRINITY_DN10213_c0_g2_i1.p1 TRINITY_DN10213_c0_g2~~TRINITY_DN10213_c0_g2_i1.p1  ORF type:complete len:350 (+),score=98.47 TRINITY_DN10213_c0_g2_i1:23-1072(+)
MQFPERQRTASAERVCRGCAMTRRPELGRLFEAIQTCMEGIDSELPLPELEPLMNEVGPYFDLCKKGEVPLLNVAVSHDDKDAAKWLLKHGANPNIVSRNGKSCLTYAIRNKSPAMLELLLNNGSDPNHLHLVQEGHRKPIYNRRGPAGRSAAQSSYTGRSALSWVMLVHGASFEDRRELFDVLIRHGADVNIRNEQGTTPIFWCAINNLQDDFDYLSLHGADPTSTTHRGETVMERATAAGYRALAHHMQVVHDAFVEGGLPAVQDVLLAMNAPAAAAMMGAGDQAPEAEIAPAVVVAPPPGGNDSNDQESHKSEDDADDDIAAATADLSLDDKGDSRESRKTPPLSG